MQKQTLGDRIQQVYPPPVLPWKKRRRRKQKSQKYRKLFLRRKTTLPFPEQSISHTDILLLLYLPNPNLPMIYFQLHLRHMVLSLSWSANRESVQRAEPRNHYTLIHASSPASLWSETKYEQYYSLFILELTGETRRGTSFYVVTNFACSHGSQERSTNNEEIEMGS